MSEKFIYKTEFGCSHPVNFLDENQVIAYDCEGSKLEIPKCEKCGYFKSQLIGRSSFKWVCSTGCENE